MLFIANINNTQWCNKKYRNSQNLSYLWTLKRYFSESALNNVHGCFELIELNKFPKVFTHKRNMYSSYVTKKKYYIAHS